MTGAEQRAERVERFRAAALSGARVPTDPEGRAEAAVDFILDRHVRATTLAGRHRIDYQAAYELEKQRELALANPEDRELWHQVPWGMWS